MTFSKLGTDIDTQQMVYLPKASRTKGVYILGLQGSGKSGLIENLCVEDGKQGTGFCVIDPHGELIDNVISRLPANREQDVILFDIRDYHYPFGLNLFTCSDPTNPLVVQEVVDQVMHVFEMLLDVNPTTPQILDYLRNCTNVLVVNPGYTMADVTLLLKNRTCREKLLQHVTDSSVLSFWHDYFDQLPLKEQLSESISLERRVRHFLQALTLNIVGQSKTSIDFRFVMDEGKILLVKLDSLRLPSVTKLIGALIIALFLNAAPSRTKKNLFNIYTDEFPLYATEDFVTLIEQARKRQIGLAMAHQNRGQLDARTSNVASKLRDRTLGTKQKIIFTITGQDADEVAGEFDVSPQAAWEEEIEKEWVEVLKAEWYERREEEVLDGTKPIPTIREDNILNHLVNKGHTSIRIRELFDILVRTLLGFSFRGHDLENKELNRILAAGQHGQFLHTSAELRTMMGDLLKYYGYWGSVNFCRPGSWTSDFISLTAEYPSMNDIDAIIQNLCASLQWDGRNHTYIIPQAVSNAVREISYWHAMKVLFFVPPTQIESSWLITEGQHRKIEEEQLQPLWSPYLQQDSEYNKLRLQFEIERRDRVIMLYRNGLNDTDPVMVARKAKAWQIAQEETTRLINFILGITELAYELSKPENHIMEDSGQVQPNMRKHITYLTHPRETLTHPRKVIMHPQRPYQDVKNDVANQLSGLPNFTARVRLDETFAQNPGKKCLSTTVALVWRDMEAILTRSEAA